MKKLVAWSDKFILVQPITRLTGEITFARLIAVDC